jgi:glutamate N-acetyltransferase/amino-acid N-acetyltransferase
MAIGNAGIEKLDVSQVGIRLGDVVVIRQGERAADYREEDGARVMREAEIDIAVELGRGAAEDTVWTCDFSYDYVKINAEYRT